MYSIKEKQELVTLLKKDNFFEEDSQLFIRKYPRHPLNRELARVNAVNRDRLHSQLLYHLLDVVKESEILENRKPLSVKKVSALEKPKKEAEKVKIDAEEQAKEIAKNQQPESEQSPETEVDTEKKSGKKE
ncbi:MAG: hypothetical protein LBS50_10250 [Prevotellaceae bacterium]|jgi:hypothetical protein|nr:hypothetical protein [Prevotellaceae bacterium]